MLRGVLSIGLRRHAGGWRSCTPTGELHLQLLHSWGGNVDPPHPSQFCTDTPARQPGETGAPGSFKQSWCKRAEVTDVHQHSLCPTS